MINSFLWNFMRIWIQLIQDKNQQTNKHEILQKLKVHKKIYNLILDIGHSYHLFGKLFFNSKNWVFQLFFLNKKSCINLTLLKIIYKQKFAQTFVLIQRGMLQTVKKPLKNLFLLEDMIRKRRIYKLSRLINIQYLLNVIVQEHALYIHFGRV